MRVLRQQLAALMRAQVGDQQQAIRAQHAGGIEKAKALGWAPQHTVEQALADVLAEMERKNPV